jgi:hypothetical protein
MLPKQQAKRALEAASPAEFAAHRHELEAFEAQGWCFRPGSAAGVFVAERSNRRRYAISLKALLADLRETENRPRVRLQTERAIDV